MTKSMEPVTRECPKRFSVPFAFFLFHSWFGHFTHGAAAGEPLLTVQAVRGLRSSDRHINTEVRKLKSKASKNRVGDADEPCISTYSTLESKLSNATDNNSFLICPGTIIVKEEVNILANGVNITCLGDSGSCILEKDSQVTGRILDVTGNGLKLVGIQFWNGAADGNGGAVRVKGGGGTPLVVKGCTFVGNTASGTGGGIHVQDHSCVVHVEGSEFIGNKASDGGGLSLVAGPIMCRMACPYEIRTSSFVANTAVQGIGGAVYSNFNLCVMENSGESNQAGANCSDIGVINLHDLNTTTCTNV